MPAALSLPKADEGCVTSAGLSLSGSLHYKARGLQWKSILSCECCVFWPSQLDRWTVWSNAANIVCRAAALTFDTVQCWIKCNAFHATAPVCVSVFLVWHSQLDPWIKTNTSHDMCRAAVLKRNKYNAITCLDAIHNATTKPIANAAPCTCCIEAATQHSIAEALILSCSSCVQHALAEKKHVGHVQACCPESFIRRY